MPSLSACALVLAGLALGPAPAAPVAAAETKAASPAKGVVEVTGEYRGYASKWMNVWLDDGTRLRFEVDDKAVPDGGGASASGSGSR